ncbi:MAG: hypothetical protein RL701_3145, partial [Pseudomonadota bacterium]
MKTVHRTLSLYGPDGFVHGTRSATCSAVLTRLNDVVARAVRMAFRGASSPKGRTSGWLSAACDVRLRDFDVGEHAVLHYELPTFGEAGPDLYRQPELFPNQFPAPDWTA